MPLCTAICKNGAPCSCKAKTGHTVCGKHMPRGGGGGAPKCCNHVMTNGKTCKRVLEEGSEMCALHRRTMERRRQRRVADEIWFAVLDALWGGDPALAQARLTAGLTEANLDQRIAHGLQRLFDDEMVFWNGANQPPPRTDLERLARDKQSVHTKEVNEQTNKTLEILLKTPRTGDPLNAVYHLGWNAPSPVFWAVLDDMKQWYETPDCRSKEDWLYRRTLDGLYTRINASPNKDELMKRLWEEAVESRGMCCDGHISRLCNVLVGFDEEFQPQLSVGERLQQKMAAIAAKEIAVEHKVGEAWVVFEELGIPKEQRMEWLEAF